MGLGEKIKDALHGDKDRKDTHQYSEKTQQAPGAYPSDEVPRYNNSNERWYGTESNSGYDTYDLNEPISQGPEYTYGYGSDDTDFLDEQIGASTSRHGPRQPARTSPTSNKPASHRKSLSKDSTRAKDEKPTVATPYWGDASTSGGSQRKKESYELYKNHDTQERLPNGSRDERRNMMNKGGNDTYNMYHPDGTHEQLQGRPRDERRAMMDSNKNRDLQSSTRGNPAAGTDPIYNLVDRTRRSPDMSGNSSVASSGMRTGMGDGHFGPGHSGARVMHRCEHCGNDSDISRYFRKDATYRME
ncbi:hypothetical protein F5Y18DRAFT_330566 [Xylariaceae sp. FL1019]|nr:hypothetical protein F5Y18DRAFT_330566 [Xylariaceae sp. FL1019]